MTETYYAIRIGDPRRHHPYLKLSADRRTPQLFATRVEAETALATEPEPLRKVVRVKIKPG